MPRTKALLEYESQAQLCCVLKAPLYVPEMPFKDRLKQAREAKKPKLTQAALGEHFGITPQAVSGWELGNAVPELEKLPKIALLLDVSLDWLLGYDEGRPDSFWPLFHKAEQLEGDDRKRVLRMFRSLLLDEDAA